MRCSSKNNYDPGIEQSSNATKGTRSKNREQNPMGSQNQFAKNKNDDNELLQQVNMKLSLQLFVSAAVCGYATANNKIPEGESCYVQWDDNSNKYKTYGDMCENGLDCNYHVLDDGATTLPIPGICEPANCLGSNSNQPPGEGTSRVTICHRICSENNPWVRITIDDGAGCGHGKEHDIWEDCNIKTKDASKWGSNHADYMIKRHGTRADVRRQLEIDNGLPEGTLQDISNSDLEKAYWKKWEPACPYVRHGKCCDWDNGECCGDDPAPEPPKIAGAGGDPHVKRWDRKNFDFHGECDLVLVHSEKVGIDDRTLDLHIRTTITDS